jgi:hypothetical protein
VEAAVTPYEVRTCKNMIVLMKVMMKTMMMVKRRRRRRMKTMVMMVHGDAEQEQDNLRIIAKNG